MRRFLLATISVLMISGLVAAPLLHSKTVSALSGSDFKPGRIIDDVVFFNKNSMSVQQIQDFLNAKVPTCDRWHAGFTGASGTRYDPPFTCIKEYNENPTTKENNIGRFNADGTPYQVTGGQSAAQIIWQASQDYGINPQVILVTLQKETGIITDDWAASWQYKTAMGYGCPDTGPNGSANCNANYYGFYNQVSSAAWQFRRYTTLPDNYNFKGGVTRYVQYNQDVNCGGASIYLENQATANLYNYTPYQPNEYALSGGSVSTYPQCGAFGNRNFYDYFTAWFGDPVGPRTALVANTSSDIVATGAYVTSDGIQHVITLKSNGDVFETWWGTTGSQYRLATSKVASTGAGSVASSAYVTSDGIQHVITLKSNGDVFETWWGTTGSQYRLATSKVASTGAGSVASSAYVTSDGIQHVITLKSNGDVFETWWGTTGSQYRLATSKVASTGAGSVASSAYVTSDGIQHVITLKSNGDVFETWWGTTGSQYRLATSKVASTGAGSVASSAYVTSDGIQHVITLKSNGDVFETWWGTTGSQYRLATSKVASTGAGSVASSAYVTSDGIQHVITLKSNGDVFETWWK